MSTERRIFLITINNYVKVGSLEEAYELNQKRANRILGGMMWMRLGNGRVQTAIDLSGLGLDAIEENDEEFKIGCMCSLRSLELHEGLNTYFQNAIKESVRHIVGTQFRNQATIGGSIFGRFGFSDILTCLLTLDSYVELYKGGVVALRDFVNMERDNDILVNVIIKKDQRAVSYTSQRITATDFPVIACGVSKVGDVWNVSVGARPMKAMLITKEMVIGNETDAETFAKDVVEQMKFGTNMRGSKEYRKHIAMILVKRAVISMMEGC